MTWTAMGARRWLFARDFQMLVLDGTSGKAKHFVETPKSKRESDRFPRILGDCLYFADFRGIGRAGDVLIKDRYWNFWVYDDTLKPLWEGSCNTGHYPFSSDIDGDGREELAIGYSLYDHDGSLLWSLDGKLHDHADGIAIVDSSSSLAPGPRSSTRRATRAF